jgi:hypothetical protein
MFGHAFILEKFASTNFMDVGLTPYFGLANTNSPDFSRPPQAGRKRHLFLFREYREALLALRLFQVGAQTHSALAVH